jgi:alanine racemase
MRYKELRLEALMSHLSSADEPEKEFTETQIKNFQSAVNTGRSMGIDLPLNSLANSAGVMAYKSSHFDVVRPGIMLYGGHPFPEFHGPVQLKPVMGLTGRIIQIRKMPGQTPISYGRTYYTDGKQKIAVISSGYSDGLPRSLSNNGKVIVAGKKVDIVGRVCMNMTMCNISGLESVRPGDEVVLLGSQGKESITGDEIAKWARTISYEIFCSIGQKVPREYII